MWYPRSDSNRHFTGFEPVDSANWPTRAYRILLGDETSLPLVVLPTSICSTCLVQESATIYSTGSLCGEPTVLWRRMWDSNPPNHFQVHGLAGRSLCHMRHPPYVLNCERTVLLNIQLLYMMPRNCQHLLVILAPQEGFEPSKLGVEIQVPSIG